MGTDSDEGEGRGKREDMQAIMSSSQYLGIYFPFIATLR